MYTENYIRFKFNDIKNKSFPEAKSSQIYFSNIPTTGYSSPFNDNVYFNPKEINKLKIGKETLTVLIAHELGHQVSYKKRNFAEKWLFLWNYCISKEKHKIAEQEANEIAQEKGYNISKLYNLEKKSSSIKKSHNLVLKLILTELRIRKK